MISYARDDILHTVLVVVLLGFNNTRRTNITNVVFRIMRGGEKGVRVLATTLIPDKLDIKYITGNSGMWYVII